MVYFLLIKINSSSQFTVCYPQSLMILIHRASPLCRVSPVVFINIILFFSITDPDPVTHVMCLHPFAFFSVNDWCNSGLGSNASKHTFPICILSPLFCFYLVYPSDPSCWANQSWRSCWCYINQFLYAFPGCLIHKSCIGI